jgi:hypothetical protein
MCAALMDSVKKGTENRNDKWNGKRNDAASRDC